MHNTHPAGAIETEIALRLESPNAHMAEHWRTRLHRRAKERSATAKAFEGRGLPEGPPFVVKITRVGSRRIDSDNLAFSAKTVRDEIAAWLGVNDGNERAVTWEYRQRIERRQERKPGTLRMRFAVWVEVWVGSGAP
jgi:predicted Fe-S protein YdhL (DUF1289 family)